MRSSFRWLTVGLWFGASLPALCGAFGTVVSIGGQSADIALDPARGLLYIANFTGNEIDVMSLATNSIQTSIPVSAPPGSLALSPDGRWLLATNYGNFAAPQSPSNALTVIDLTTQTTQTFALGDAPLGVAFGMDGLALVVTQSSFLLFDPVLQTSQQIGTISGLVNQTLPVPPANVPAQITNASLAVSGDGMTIYGLGGSTSTFTFRFQVNGHSLWPGGITLYSGVLAPHVVSVNQNGTLFVAGWVLLNTQGEFLSYFPQRANEAGVGTSAFDSARGLIYAQIPATAGEPPVLQIVDQNNLRVYQRLNLPENTTGKSLLSPDGNTLYSVSASGVLVLPVGSLALQPRVVAAQRDLLFQGQPCSSQVAVQSLTIFDPGGGNTAFSLSSSTPGVNVSPSSGVTPATVHVSVDPSAFGGQNGTVTASLSLSSSQAVNIPDPVRVLINGRQSDQRGTIVNVPGLLVDVLADPVRNRFYVLRQDTDEVLVFDGTTFNQIAALKTGNVPTGMAITFDQHYLLVADEQSQIVSVYDLITLQTLDPIRMPDGYSAFSLASSSNRILAAAQYYDGTSHIVSLDLPSRTGSALPSLGVFTNLINNDTVVTASTNGSSILAAGADGSLLLYDANRDTFAASRKDLSSLSGAYAASNFNQFVAGDSLLDSSLVPEMQLESATGAPSGFAFVDQGGFRAMTPLLTSANPGGSGSAGSGGSGSGAPAPSGPASAAGVMERVDLSAAASGNPVVTSTRLAEAPLTGPLSTIFSSGFTRTVAPLANRNSIIVLTVSGFVALPWSYDTGVAQPVIQSVVNAADGSPSIAPGGLITIYGQNLSPVNQATSQVPLPTALADSCLGVNGLALPILYVSPNQINAQMPFQAVGDVSLILHTPGGTSNTYNVQIMPGAPSVFRSGSAGPISHIPTIIRDGNQQLVTLSNPIHFGDTLTIYLTGLGLTMPSVPSGQPAPSSPLATTVDVPQVTLGGSSLPVQFSGLAPGQIGVYQINVTVPKGVPTGFNVPFAISQDGGYTSIDVRVIN